MKHKIYKLLDELNYGTDQKLVSGDLNAYVEKITERSKIVSIQHNNELHGFISYYDNDKTSKIAFLTMLAINKDFQHLGYGLGLLNFSISNLKRLKFKTYCLEVLKDNEIAVSLYKKFGFIVIKEDSIHYYMEKEL